MMLTSIALFFSLLPSITTVVAQQTPSPPPRDPRALPIVDLDYTWQQASSFDSDGRLFIFNNIRYGEPPVGDLRFAAPVAAKENHTIQTGADERICIQGFPTWTKLSSLWLPTYISGNQTAISEFLAHPPALDPEQQIPPMGPTETEDCLFLDVVVPQGIFQNRTATGLAPVLVWIYGGGYAFGHKKANANPAGLIDRSGDGIVYVAINYRLGAFGWLGGPSLKAANGIPNAGLHDQRLALDWVQKYIHLFGGDPSRVTVMGESAGGGSIMHHITAYGGAKGPAPFQQAVPQSAAWLPLTSEEQQEEITSTFLDAAGVSTIEAARDMTMEELRHASCLVVSKAPYAQYGFGPVVDGDYVPALPSQLLLEGKFDKNVALMIGHQSNEGLRYVSPFINNDAALTTLLSTSFPQFSSKDISYITETLYPPSIISPNPTPNLHYTDINAASKPPTSAFDRATLFTAESCFTCNTYYLSTAYSPNTYNYIFNVSGAQLHGQDVPYTFFSTPTPYVAYEDVARVLQRYIVFFVMYGEPAGDRLPRFPSYGEDGHVFEFSETGFRSVEDETANDRCKWWQTAFEI